MDYWLYDITDHRTITIVEIQDVWLYTDYRTWAKLDTGGWIRLESITDTSNNSNNTTDETPPEETTTKEPVQLEGVYIPNGGGYRSVYGCGNKHTSIVDGIEFIWYDRYESRDKDNTRVYDSLDIISLDVEHTIAESGLYVGEKTWLFSYEMQLSDNESIMLY